MNTFRLLVGEHVVVTVEEELGAGALHDIRNDCLLTDPRIPPATSAICVVGPRYAPLAADPIRIPADDMVGQNELPSSPARRQHRIQPLQLQLP